jgi:hypothetical protein
MPLTEDDVRERLGFARRRIEDLTSLNHGDVLGADLHERQMLMQEVFFHLVGAIEVFAQLVNEQRKLVGTSEDVTISQIAKWLAPGDPLIALVDNLYARPRNQSLPPNPYIEDGLIFRLWNYRH